jgi:hypothetical protein
MLLERIFPDVELPVISINKYKRMAVKCINSRNYMLKFHFVSKTTYLYVTDGEFRLLKIGTFGVNEIMKNSSYIIQQHLL